MLKMFYSKLKRKKDYRFLDSEVYRKQSKSLREEKAMFELSEQAALKVDFYSVSERATLADIEYFITPTRQSPLALNTAPKARAKLLPKASAETDEDLIKVEDTLTKPSASVGDYLVDEYIVQDKLNHDYPVYDYLVQDCLNKDKRTNDNRPAARQWQDFEINDIEYLTPPSSITPFNYYDEVETARAYRAKKSQRNTGLPRLGVFSDSRVYSAFVKTELSKLEVNVRHFNHPSSFNTTNTSYLDSIDAWIVFLSDDSDESFLDEFIDRYIEKPTLFLVPKTKRRASSSRIIQFVQELTPEQRLPA